MINFGPDSHPKHKPYQCWHVVWFTQPKSREWLTGGQVYFVFQTTGRLNRSIQPRRRRRGLASYFIKQSRMRINCIPKEREGRTREKGVRVWLRSLQLQTNVTPQWLQNGTNNTVQQVYRNYRTMQCVHTRHRPNHCTNITVHQVYGNYCPMLPVHACNTVVMHQQQ